MPRARLLPTLLKVTVLLPVYAVALGLAWLFRSPRRTLLLLLPISLALAGAWHLSACGRPLRIGTFNIREFGVASTDMDALTTLMRSLDADIVAVQEIQSETKLRELAARLARSVTLSRCGGKSAMQIGLATRESVRACSVSSRMARARCTCWPSI